MEELIGKIIGVVVGVLTGGVSLALVFKFFQDNYAKALAGFLVRVKHYMGVIGPTTQEKPIAAHREAVEVPEEETTDRDSLRAIHNVVAFEFYIQNMKQAEIAENHHIAGPRVVRRYLKEWRDIWGIEETNKDDVRLLIERNQELSDTLNKMRL
jgi:hypothetical protein